MRDIEKTLEYRIKQTFKNYIQENEQELKIKRKKIWCKKIRNYEITKICIL